MLLKFRLPQPNCFEIMFAEPGLFQLDQIGEVADDLKPLFSPPVVIALNGGLGAGKTTLMAAIVRSIGSADQVSSPTYVLQHLYEADGLTIEHWDLYRLSALPEELAEPPSSDTLRFIEWAERIDGYQEFCDLEIRLTIPDPKKEEQRAIQLIHFHEDGTAEEG